MRAQSHAIHRRAAGWGSAAMSAAAILIAGAGQAAAAAPVAPWVHVQGNGFANAAGQPVVLRGVDQQGGAGKMSDQAAATLGANVVRVLVPWSSIETAAPVAGVHTYSASQLAAVDAQVAWYQAHGINVLLDFHQFKWSPYFKQPGAEGIPSWYYSVAQAGRFSPDSDGLQQAMAAWWTDPVGQADYVAFVQTMEARYSGAPNVVGYELLNEPMVGSMGENHAAAQAVINWEAPVAAAMRAADPSRAIFFMLRGGGDNGLLNADLSAFGGLTNMVLDLHDYYNGLYGSGFTPDDENWAPSWDATHNQNFTNYHGTEYAQEQNLQVAINRTRALGIPLFIGEWGVQTQDSGAAAFQSQMLDLFNRYGLSWARWDIGRNDPFTLLNSDYSENGLGRSVRQALAVPAATSGLVPAADVAPTLSGFAQVTQTLSVAQGLWAGVPTPAVTYQWLRCNAAGAACLPVPGATGATYLLGTADLGGTLRVAVTGTSSAGSATATTAQSGVVAAFALTLAGTTAATSPVSPAITITWSQNQTADLRIEIRNAAGTVVKHLLYQGSYAPGTWVKKWGRLSDKGAFVPSGTYTVMITASTSTATTSASVPVTF